MCVCVLLFGSANQIQRRCGLLPNGYLVEYFQMVVVDQNWGSHSVFFLMIESSLVLAQYELVCAYFGFSSRYFGRFCFSFFGFLVDF